MVATFRNYVLLCLIGLYLVFNYGFMLVRIPPTMGSGIPIGEIVLIFSLLSLGLPSTLPGFIRVAPILPLVLWWTTGIGRALMGVPRYGLWAFRDANQVIESLFLIVGFAFALEPKWLERFFKFLPRLLIVVTIYILMYPFRETLWDISPRIMGAAGHSVPLIGTYINFSLLLLPILYLVIYGKGKDIFLAGFLLAFGLVFFQTRTFYLQVILLLVLVLWKRASSLKIIIPASIVVLFLLLLIQAIDLPIEGRLGQAFSFDFLVKHFKTIWGVTAREVKGAAGGFYLRMKWWHIIYKRLSGSMVTLLFGFGYGMPLVDFAIKGGVAVREPHNSYISIIARMGTVGAMLFLWIHIVLIRVWSRCYQICTSQNWMEWQNRLLILAGYFVWLWVFAIGEDAFEKPCFAIPYYFFWGIILAFHHHLKNEIPEGA